MNDVDWFCSRGILMSGRKLQNMDHCGYEGVCCVCGICILRLKVMCRLLQYYSFFLNLSRPTYFIFETIRRMF